MASEDDEEEYLPSDMDEEAFLQQAYATDEEGYMQGATTGVCECAGGHNVAGDYNCAPRSPFPSLHLRMRSQRSCCKPPTAS
jgi:hypothetical protein